MSSESTPRGSNAEMTTSETSIDQREDGEDEPITVAELRIPAADVALENTFQRLSSVTLRVESVAGRRPDQPFAHAWIGGCDTDNLTAALDDDPSVDLESVLVRREGEQFCELEFGEPVSLLTEAVYSSGGTVLSAKASEGTWRLCLRFSDRSSLSDLMTLLDRFDIRADLRQVSNGDGASRQRLTNKQREALAAAHEEGYFEVPRQASLEEVASDLGISHQAMSERLRRGQNALLRSEIVG